MTIENIILSLAYIGYISLSSLAAYFLLKAKSQLPSDGIPGLVFMNFVFLGVIPFVALLMKYPPKNPGLAESDEYYNKGKIWIWNK